MVTTVSISGQPSTSETLYGGKYQYFEIYFNPPDTIAGRLCRLEVKTCTAITTGLKTSAEDFSCFVMLDWTQPNSFSSIFDEIRNGSNTARLGKVPGLNNRVVSHLICFPDGTDYTLMRPHTDSAKCMVQIPEGPHVLQIGVFKNQTISVVDVHDININNLALTMEIQPFEED